VEIVKTGSDPETDRVVRWRRIDLKAVIERRFGVVYHQRSLSRLLHALGFSHISARPQHPEQDAEALDSSKDVWPAPGPQAVSLCWLEAVCLNVSAYLRRFELLASMGVRASRSS
jgi:hypothetical protein